MYLEPRLIPYVEFNEPKMGECAAATERTATSTSLKELLAKTCPETTAKDWKRIKKVKIEDAFEVGSVLRVFDHVKTNQRALVETGNRHGTKLEIFLIPNELETKIIEAANQITHCGDYGEVIWNPVTQSVVMVLGDGDPIEPDPEDCIKLFTAIPGVKSAELLAEDYPYEDEEDPGDWKHLGVRGKASEEELAAVKTLPGKLAEFGVANLAELNRIVMAKDGSEKRVWTIGRELKPGALDHYFDGMGGDCGGDGGTPPPPPGPGPKGPDDGPLPPRGRSWDPD